MSQREHDTMSEDGAASLARRLDYWWHSRGFLEVQHWVERSVGKRRYRKEDGGPNGQDGIWVVRSNLVGGLPPSKARRDA